MKSDHHHAGRIYMVATTKTAPASKSVPSLWIHWCDTCNRVTLERSAPGGSENTVQVVLREGEGQRELKL